MLGKAMDFFIPGVSLAELRVAGLRLQRGGVGFYPSSGSPFVHLDVGSVRHWPRMTREQLVKVFPDGRTVHLPTDGHPLAGYALALADIERRGNAPSATSLAAAREDGAVKSAKPNLFAKLFGFGKNKDEDDDNEVTASTAKPAAQAVASRAAAPAAEAPADKEKAARPVAVAAIRLPLPRPATFSMASVPANLPASGAKPDEKPAAPVRLALAAAKTPVQASAQNPLQGAGAAPASANEVIATRGYWRGLPETQPAPAPVRVAAATPAISPWPDAPRRNAEDRPHLLLAYAVEPAREPAHAPARVSPMGASVVRALPGASNASVAIKQSGRPAIVKPVRGAAEAAAPAPAKSGASQDQPWLRAIVLTPSAYHFLTATLLGANDYRTLRPLIAKPSSTVAASFSDDPQPGMTTAAFSGKAVVFTATVLFDTRNAALQQ